MEVEGEEGTFSWGPSARRAGRQRETGGERPVGGGLGGGWLQLLSLGPALKDSQAAQGVQAGPGCNRVYAGLPAECELPMSETYPCVSI